MTPEGKARYAGWGLALVAGVAVGTLGTMWHRVALPWGLVVVIALTLISTICARILAGYGGLVWFGLGWVVMVQVMSLTGPGGSVLIVDSTFAYGPYAGYAWLIGGALSFLIVAFCPPKWFRGDAIVRFGRRSGAAAPPDAHDQPETGHAPRD